MNRFWKISPWLVRLILLPPTVIFALIASRYLLNPIQAASAVGIAFTSPLGITIARVGFAGFPLGCSIFTLSCLLSTRRLLTGLRFVGTMIAAALAVRVYGMIVDGTTAANMHLVRAEIILLVIVTIGAFVETARQRRLQHANA
jgi:hypothetical protein